MMNDDDFVFMVRAPKLLMALIIDGDILGKDRQLARSYGERIYKISGFPGMQRHALNLRIAYEYCCPFKENDYGEIEPEWKSHPQEYDFAWDGIGPWRP